MAKEAHNILHAALSKESPRARSLGHAIHERFGALGGVDLPEIQREAIRRPLDRSRE